MVVWSGLERIEYKFGSQACLGEQLCLPAEKLHKVKSVGIAVQSWEEGL